MSDLRLAMHKFASLFLAYLSFCAGRPQLKAVLTDLRTEGLRSRGFPAISSSPNPLSLLPRNQTAGLSRELDPGSHPELEASAIFYNTEPPAIAPRGGHLITSLIFAAFHCWVDEENHAFMGKSIDNYVPFLNIWHIIQPSFGVRGAVLNRQKVGMIYCTILQGIFQEPIWPGHIHVDILQQLRTIQPRSLGKLDVENLVTKGTRDSGLRKKNDFVGTLRQDLVFKIFTGLANISVEYVPRPEPIDEKVCLQLFTTVLLWAFQNQWQVRLCSTSLGLHARLYEFRCAIDPTRWFSLVITKWAVIPRSPYRWLDLVEDLMHLLVETVLESRWETFYWLPLRRDGNAFAWVSLGDRLTRPLPPYP